MIFLRGCRVDFYSMATLQAQIRKGGGIISTMIYFLTMGSRKSLRLTRNSCTTMKPGQDEPQYDARHDKVNKTIKNLEMLDPDPEDFDLVLPDSDDDRDHDLGDNVRKKRKTKRKKTRKVLSLESFMNLSNDAVLAAITFHHYHGEGDNDFIEWTILREVEEIVDDVMQHDNTSPFSIDIPWQPGVGAVDYFEIFSIISFHLSRGKLPSSTSTCQILYAQGTLLTTCMRRLDSINPTGRIQIIM